MAKRKYYPSTPKSNTDWAKMSDENQGIIDLVPLTNFNDEATKVFDNWSKKFSDEWVNNIASISANNSIAQYNEFILNRLSYVECSHLAIDPIISNAITKFANGMTRKGGEIILDDELENKDDILMQIEARFEELGGMEKINELIKTCLVYGRASLFLDVNTDVEKLEKKLVLKKETISENQLTNLQIVPPYGMGAVSVETSNMLNKDYMKPSKWYIQGAGTVDSSRLIDLVIFDCPTLIKPIFNFGGISLCQFMKDYVSTADSTRKSLADIALRFKTDIIKTNLSKVNPVEAKARAKLINQYRNNLGLLLLTEDELFEQVNTPISGLEKISAHQMEYVSVAGRIPATILFGLTPAGLNATGEQESNNYYDELEAIQNSDLKPIIEKILHIICLEMDLDIKPKFKFNELKKDNELQTAQVQGTYIDNAIKLKDAGLATGEQSIDYVKENKALNDSFQYDDGAELNEEMEFEFDPNNSETLMGQ